MRFRSKPQKTDRTDRHKYVGGCLKMARSGVSAREVVDKFGGNEETARLWLRGLEDEGILTRVGKHPMRFFLNMEVLSGKSQRVD